MARYRTIWFIFLFESCTIILSHAADNCNKVDSCSCTFSDGTSLDLHPLASSDKFAFPYTAPSQSDGYEYAWNPCNPVTDSGDCTNAASCRRSVGSNDPINIGTQESAIFDTSDSNIKLKYQNYGSDGNLYDTWVELECDQSTDKEFTVAGETGFLIYQYKLKSKCCCPDGCKGGIGGGGGGLSFGSILCITVSVLIVVYIAAGIAFAVYKGKSGVEMIPNYAFWKDFPYLVKDGCSYVVGLAQKVTSGAVSSSEKSGTSYGSM